MSDQMSLFPLHTRRQSACAGKVPLISTTRQGHVSHDATPTRDVVLKYTFYIQNMAQNTTKIQIEYKVKWAAR